MRKNGIEIQEGKKYRVYVIENEFGEVGAEDVVYGEEVKDWFKQVRDEFCRTWTPRGLTYDEFVEEYSGN